MKKFKNIEKFLLGSLFLANQAFCPPKEATVTESPKYELTVNLKLTNEQIMDFIDRGLVSSTTCVKDGSANPIEMHAQLYPLSFATLIKNDARLEAERLITEAIAKKMTNIADAKKKFDDAINDLWADWQYDEEQIKKKIIAKSIQDAEYIRELLALDEAIARNILILSKLKDNFSQQLQPEEQQTFEMQHANIKAIISEQTKNQAIILAAQQKNIKQIKALKAKAEKLQTQEKNIRMANFVKIMEALPQLAATRNREILEEMEKTDPQLQLAAETIGNQPLDMADAPTALTLREFFTKLNTLNMMREIPPPNQVSTLDQQNAAIIISAIVSKILTKSIMARLQHSSYNYYANNPLEIYFGQITINQPRQQCLQRWIDILKLDKKNAENLHKLINKQFSLGHKIAFIGFYHEFIRQSKGGYLTKVIVSLDQPCTVMRFPWA